MFTYVIFFVTGFLPVAVEEVIRTGIDPRFADTIEAGFLPIAVISIITIHILFARMGTHGNIFPDILVY